MGSPSEVCVMFVTCSILAVLPKSEENISTPYALRNGQLLPRNVYQLTCFVAKINCVVR